MVVFCTTHPKYRKPAINTINKTNLQNSTPYHTKSRGGRGDMKQTSYPNKGIKGVV